MTAPQPAPARSDPRFARLYALHHKYETLANRVHPDWCPRDTSAALADFAEEAETLNMDIAEASALCWAMFLARST